MPVQAGLCALGDLAALERWREHAFVIRRRRLDELGDDQSEHRLQPRARTDSSRRPSLLTTLDPGPMLAGADLGTRTRIALRLQQSEGNARVVQRLAGQASTRGDMVVQRQALSTVPKFQLRKDLFLLRGVTDIQPKDPATPDEDDRPKFWVLDFDALVDDDSPLGRAIAEQERIKQIYSGKPKDDTPLSLNLSNAAFNILTSTPPGQNLLDKLHLKNVTIVLDPTQGNYGLSVKFKLNWL